MSIRLRNIFEKKQYLDCPHLKHSLHFFYDEIRACCSNVPGPIFYPNFEGGNVDWNYIYSLRKNYYKEIDSFFSETSMPRECLKCFDAKASLKDKKNKKFPNLVSKIYFHNHMSCNAKCSYCTYAHIENGYKYKVYPLVKSLIDNNLLAKDASIFMSGGEPTISPEFEQLLDLFISYLNGRNIEILTSGIKYCKSIEDAFVQDKLKMVLSLDSGTRVTYLKIKGVDCFDKVIENLKKYVLASNYAKENITLKYIIVDKENDNIDEIDTFFDVVTSLEIKNVRIDIDYEKYKFTRYIRVPDYYFDLINHFNNKAYELSLNVCNNDQVKAVLDKSNR